MMCSFNCLDDTVKLETLGSRFAILLMSYFDYPVYEHPEMIL